MDREWVSERIRPSIAAVIVVHVSDDDLREWARGIIDWRVHPKWYTAAIGIPAAIAFGAGAIAYVVGAPIDYGAFSPALLTLLFGIILGTFIGGGQEVIGWRGFAQPYLNDRYDALTASLIIGVVWAVWHLPYFLIPITPHSGFTVVNQVGWFVSIVLLSVILGWAYNGTGSVLIVIVLHAMVNNVDILLPLGPDQLVVDGIIVDTAVATVTVTQVAVTFLVVVAIVAYFGRDSLARGDIPGVAYIRGETQ